MPVLMKIEHFVWQKNVFVIKDQFSYIINNL